MSERYSVRLCKEQTVFSAAHFITFNGNVCERLHGHNYRVEVQIHGNLDENQYVVDFIALRDALQRITTELDHHVLLPTEHPSIRVAANEREVTATFEDRRWIFPRSDCVLLPVANTTAELLARYVGQRLQAALPPQRGASPPAMRVAVEENFGQWGVCDLEF